MLTRKEKKHNKNLAYSIMFAMIIGGMIAAPIKVVANKITENKKSDR